MRRRGGFAFIEVLVAIAIMGMIFLIVSAYYPLASITALRGRDQTTASELATQRLEQVRSRPFTWLTQGNVNSQFNLAGGNPNCPGTDSEVLDDQGSCYDDATDSGVKYTRVTMITTSYTGQAKLTKVLVQVKWPQDSSTCDAEADTACVSLATVLVNWP